MYVAGPGPAGVVAFFLLKGIEVSKTPVEKELIW